MCRVSVGRTRCARQKGSALQNVNLRQSGNAFLLCNLKPGRWGKAMWKPIVVVAAALVLASLSVVYAQQQYGRDDGNISRRYQHHRMSAEDIAAFTDARIAALKAGLELTPDQAKNWPAFEQALRDMAELRAQRRKARKS